MAALLLTHRVKSQPPHGILLSLELSPFQINFTSALLLHSCTTILLKEPLNCLELTRRLLIKTRIIRKKSQALGVISVAKTSAVLDAYTSIFSNDTEGELSELYFTNTGVALLALSLSSSVAMNLILSDLALNLIVAGTFGLTFVVSLACGRAKYTLPLMALRRAGRFIWSGTPFVNFFSLIYIATVLKGQSILRLQDNIAFRSIVVFECLLMKAKIASADRETQISQVRKLIATERVAIHSYQKSPSLSRSKSPSLLHRHDIKAFSTLQRMSVMFLKTSIGYEYGNVTCPARLPLPGIGNSIEEPTLSWKLGRLSKDLTILADYLAGTNRADDTWSQVRSYMHGMLLRRLGKKRVVYLVRKSPESTEKESSWYSNANLVTGVDATWLNDAFMPGQTTNTCAVTGFT